MFKIMVHTLNVVLTGAVTLKIYSYFSVPYVHSPFVVREEMVKTFKSPSWEKRRYVFNSDGARGYTHRNAKWQIGIIGDSSALGLLVGQDHSWGERLKAHFPFPLHVETFGIDSVGDQDLVTLVQDLKKKGKKYDLLIVLQSFGVAYKKTPFRSSWMRGLDPSQKFWAPVQFWWFRFSKGSKILARLRSFVSLAIEQAQATSGVRPEVEFNFDKRQSDEFKYINKPIPIYKSMVNEMKNSLSELTKKAKEISQYQIYVPGFFAYDKHMRPEILKRYSLIWPIQEGLAYDSDSLSEHLGSRRELATQILKQLDAKVYDFMPFVKPKLKVNEDLFLDEVHLSKMGSDLFARWVYGRVKASGFLDE